MTMPPPAAALRGLSVRILEARPELGGQLTALCPDRRVYEITVMAPAQAGFSVAAEATWQLGSYLPDLSYGLKVRPGHSSDRRLPGPHGRDHR